MSVSNVEVGKKVKEMRLHNNMSQQEFSERTHITQSALIQELLLLKVFENIEDIG